MLDQRLREGTEAVKAALADAIPPAVDDVFLVEDPATRAKVGWRGPLIAVGTAVAVLVLVAAAAFLFRGDGFSGEPAATPPPPEVSTPVATTAAVIGDAAGSWQVTDIAEPWVRSIVDVAPLPGGGFVVAVTDGGSVLWSPDGIDWTEADPNGEVTATAPSEFSQQPQAIAVLADRVAILDSGGPRVSVGDLATGAWESISLDTAGLIGDSRSWAIASNDRQILVVESLRDPADYVAWLIDPETGEVDRHTLPSPSRADEGPGYVPVHPQTLELQPSLAALWFEDRWVIALGTVTAVSHDGMTWTLGLVSLPGDPAIVTSLTAGPAGIVVTTCRGLGGHPTFYSEDGLEWTRVPEHEQFSEQAQANHSGATHSDDIGFVMTFADSGGDDDALGRLDSSPDGRSWSSIDVEHILDGNLAASGTSIFVDHRVGASLLTPAE